MKALLSILTFLGAALFLPCSAETPVPSSAAPAPAKPAVIKSRQSKVKGLLVTPIGTDDYIGSASQMNATVVPAPDAAASMRLMFNQDVGKDMKTALREVEKFLLVRHDELPKGSYVEISFEDKFMPKDGPSAAAACAVMVESLFTGEALDENFACTGDMNADGSIQPVGGVPDKIEGAVRRKCSTICVPEKCSPMVVDYSIRTGLRTVAAIQIFTASTFEEVQSLARANRAARIKNSIDSYRRISIALSQPDALATLKKPETIAALKQILKDTPNCLSATLLLATAEDKAPKIMSAAGSYHAVLRLAKVIALTRRSEGIESFAAKADLAALEKETNALSAMRPRIDARVRPFIDSVIKFARIFRRLGAMNHGNAQFSLTNVRQELKAAAEALKKEEDKLKADKTLMSELLEH